MKPTPYTEINGILEHYQTQLEEILGEQFYALYLAGSLVTGDFNLNSSDIDVIVVTADVLPDKKVTALYEMHKVLHALDTKWGIEIEAAYIPLANIRRYNPSDATHPHIERGDTLRVEHLDRGWIIQRFIVREYGVALKGPLPKTLIDPISADELCQVATDKFYQLCFPQIENPKYLDRVGSTSYVILSLCRILHTLEHGTLVSKPVAGKSLLRKLDKPFRVVIEQALQWSETGEDDNIPQSHVIELIRYADREIKLSGFSAS